MAVYIIITISPLGRQRATIAILFLSAQLTAFIVSARDQPRILIIYKREVIITLLLSQAGSGFNIALGQQLAWPYQAIFAQVNRLGVLLLYIRARLVTSRSQITSLIIFIIISRTIFIIQLVKVIAILPLGYNQALSNIIILVIIRSQILDTTLSNTWAAILLKIAILRFPWGLWPAGATLPPLLLSAL